MKPRRAARHALVFGGSSGLGAGVATELVARGWRVTVLARRRPSSDLDGRSFVACDVTRADAVERAIEQAIAEGGAADAVVYSAGRAVFGKTLAVPEDAARAAFEANYWGFERVVRAVAPHMFRAGHGAVALVSSIAATRAVAFEAHYAASKAAASRFLECFALEASARGVRVAEIIPGFVDTGFLERGGWHGFATPPAVSGSGVSARDVGRATADAVEGKGSTRVILGWRENAIALADRAVPGAYDRLLRARMRRTRSD